jgi:hypothetical protein
VRPSAARGGTTLALGAGVVALVLAFLVIGRERETAGPPSRAADAAPAVGATYAAPGAAAAPPGEAAGSTWLSAASQVIGSQRAALVEQLRTSRDARDALRLFDLLDACMEFRHGRSTDADACDGLSDAALAGREDALQRAVDGRAAGAVVRLFYAGTDGAVQDDPGDPRRDAMRARLEPLLADAIQHGDVEALSAGMFEYQVGADFPRDPVRALTYVTVAMDIERERGRGSSGLALQAARLSSELTAQQRAVALAQAQQLFAQAFRGKPAQ